MRLPVLAALLLLAVECFSEPNDSIPGETARTSYGISLQPYKYKMAIESKVPMVNADVLIAKDRKWYFLKASWFGNNSESDCYGCNATPQYTPSTEEFSWLRIGFSRRFLFKETGFSFFHEPGVNLIRWHWRYSEFMQFIPGTTTYREDRNEYEFIGLQPIEYGGMQWHFHGFLATFAIGIGANLGLNEESKSGVVQSSGRFTVPLSIPEYSFVSGDINFGLGYVF
jgi:hypothetical protein